MGRQPHTVNLAIEDAVPIDRARTSLAILWLVGPGCIFATLIAQSLLGRFGKASGPDSPVEEVWSWALPTMLPTLTMILSVVGYTALETNRSNVEVRGGFLSIAWWLSLSYLLSVFATILVIPLGTLTPLELMKMSNLWLAPFQGLVASALGVLFVSKRRKEN